MAISGKDTLGRHKKRFRIEHCQSISQLARKIRKRALRIKELDEKRWAHLLKTTVFEKLIDMARKARSRDRQCTATEALARFKV